MEYKKLDDLKSSGCWMVRNDENGISYGGYKVAPVGVWQKCPKWDKKTVADCKSGGFFGQGPGGYGFAKYGSRFTFCETKGKRLSVGGDKIKVPEFRVIYENFEALKALFYVVNDNFQGSLNLRGCTIPEGFQIGDVGGSLDLRGCTIPEGFQIGDVGGSLNLRGCTIPEGFQIGGVGDWLDLRGCTIPEGFQIGDVGGYIFK